MMNDLAAGWVSGDSPTVERFEEAICNYTNRKFGLAVSNGSDALELAIAGLDLPLGGEVIVPSFTIISCLLPILRLGLTPIFVDAEPHTWNLDTANLESVLTSKTVGIMAVHIYGMSPDMPKVLAFAERHNLAVIEDASEALGQVSYGYRCGGMGTISTLSFYANKNLTTGEGGMVLTDDPTLAERMRSLRNLTFRSDRRFVHDSMGWNMRLSSMQAALGLSQSMRIDEAVERRITIARQYREALEGCEFIEMQPFSYAGGLSTFWVVGILLKSHPRFPDAIGAMSALHQVGVGTRPFFFPLHKQPLLDKFAHKLSSSKTLEVSENLGRLGFYVPNGLGLASDALQEAVEKVGNVLRVS